MLRVIVIVANLAWLLLICSLFQAPHWNQWTPQTVRLVLLFWGTPTLFAFCIDWALNRERSLVGRVFSAPRDPRT